MPGALAGLVLVLTAASCGDQGGQPDASPSPSSTGTERPVQDPVEVVVPQRSVGEAPAMRLADGVTPPTNAWFSGLVFGDGSHPVFGLPMSFALTEGGFSLGLPPVSSTSETIAGPHVPAVGVSVPGTEAEVTDHDPVSATLGFRDDNGSDVGSLVLAAGSPFVSYTANQEQTVQLDVALEEAGDDLWTTTQAGQDYGLLCTGCTVTTEAAGSTVELPESASLTIYAVPDGAQATDLTSWADPVTGVDVAHSVESGTAATTLRYRTVDGGPTLVAALPHHRVPSETCTDWSYMSVLGEMRLCEGDEFTTTVDALEPTGQLDLSGLSEQDREGLREQVRADLQATDLAAADTYFGGKELYRAATLVTLAEQVGAGEAAEPVRTATTEALRNWLEPGACEEREERCFVYDPALKGMVGLAPSFGSEEFNDHHFHYGYFLYAAGLLGMEDPELVADVAPVANLLAADIASTAGDPAFPQLRAFDPYAGHSWASGYSPFGDGNNQESTSEAVTAWNGLALWAQASDDEQLAERATWMMSVEAETAVAYWTMPDLSAPEFSDYEHDVVGIGWGGKRDYATWFSPEPNAILGIQLIPMSPVATYLDVDAGHIEATVAEAAPGGFDVQFGDYLLMYLALADPDGVQEMVGSLPEESIDGANSRSYLQAWVLAAAAGSLNTANG